MLKKKKLHQGDLQFCKPMSLCFLEGPEDGIGKCLGKNPKKWPVCWWGEFGVKLKTLVLLEPWQWLIVMKMKMNHRSRIIRGTLLHELPIQELLIKWTFQRVAPAFEGFDFEEQKLVRAKNKGTSMQNLVCILLIGLSLWFLIFLSCVVI